MPRRIADAASMICSPPSGASTRAQEIVGAVLLDELDEAARIPSRESARDVSEVQARDLDIEPGRCRLLLAEIDAPDLRISEDHPGQGRVVALLAVAVEGALRGQASLVGGCVDESGIADHASGAVHPGGRGLQVIVHGIALVLAQAEACFLEAHAFGDGPPARRAEDMFSPEAVRLAADPGDTVEDLRLALLDFQRSYNERWIRAGYGYRTPNQVRDALTAIAA